MDWLIPRAAYVHIPFCAHHCGYCDFAVSTDQSLKELYLDALALELAGELVTVDTIFIGGGTPTSLDVPQLERLMQLLHRRFAGPWSECTIESTPDSLSKEKLELLKSHGVDRISVGVQSYSEHTRLALDRKHNLDAICNGINAVIDAELELSLDLIFGAPGQSLVEWMADLGIVLEIRPDHVSTYGLTYEKGTPFWKRRKSGELHAIGEDMELAMYETAIDKLTAKGYEHYEISNFAWASKLRRCYHNEHYWANHAYYGFGVGAARYLQGTRSVNTRDTKTYIRRILAGDDPTQSSETLPPRERALETMAVQLRRTDGITRERYLEQTGFALNELIHAPLRHLVDEGLMIDAGSSVHISRRGRALADGIIEKLMQG